MPETGYHRHMFQRQCPPVALYATCLHILMIPRGGGQHLRDDVSSGLYLRVTFVVEYHNKCEVLPKMAFG
jgi:hypothetical protein